jgi:allantoin racemase
MKPRSHAIWRTWRGPTLQLKTFGIEETPSGKDRYRASFHIVVSHMVKSVLRAEPQGFDAVAVVNTLDHGYYEMRELLDIPVVFITESAMHLACQLAPGFSFVTHNAAMQRNVTELAKRYGLTERMVAGAHLDLTYEDFPKMYDDPETYVDLFATSARQAIDRGAALLMVAGNPLNMFLIDQGVREIDGVPILDCCTAAVKSAELMVDLHRLGIRRSTKGLFAAPPPEAKENIRALFSKEP